MNCFIKQSFFSMMLTVKVNLGTVPFMPWQTPQWTKEQLQWWYWWNYWQNFMKKEEGEYFPLSIYKICRFHCEIPRNDNPYNKVIDFKCIYLSVLKDLANYSTDMVLLYRVSSHRSWEGLENLPTPTQQKTKYYNLPHIAVVKMFFADQLIIDLKKI